jgi:hypothetical protein
VRRVLNETQQSVGLPVKVDGRNVARFWGVMRLPGNSANMKSKVNADEVPVSRLLGLLAAGETRESILKAYPYLEAADIDEALRYAAFLAEDETVELAE